MTGLIPNTTYYYRAVAETETKIYGNELSFTTAPAPPMALTTGAFSVTDDSATLGGYVNANNSATSVTFQYTTISGDYTNAIVLPADPATVNGTTATAVNGTATGLATGTTYYYRIVAVNAGGTTYSDEVFFRASVATPPPMAQIANATNMTTDSATLNGQIFANDSATTVKFQIGQRG